MELLTLGSLALEGVDFRRSKPLLLLSYLALEGPRPRRELAGLFWKSGRNPRGSLSSTLSLLGKEVPGCVGTTAERVWAEVDCDAAAVLELLDAGRSAEAVARYGGPFLEGLDLPLGEELEEWVYGTREYLADRVRAALLRLGEQAYADRRFADAAGYAERALLLRGATEPEPTELIRLYPLLHQGGSARIAELRARAEAFGLDLEAPSSADWVLPIKSALNAERSNLPVSMKSFVGRDLELVQLAELLDDPGCRVLTITGPGGVGKSRLALQLAWDQLRQQAEWEGIYLVRLEAVASAALVAPAIAEALGLDLTGSDRPLEQLAHAIGERRVLLLLNNFEHLMAAAPEVAELAGACRNLKLLATSRERLQLAAERAYPLEGLPVPAAAPHPEASQELYQDAAQLFMQRARDADLRLAFSAEALPGIHEICRLVHGLPLGIELAAAWARLMPPEEIAREIASNLDFLTTTGRNTKERHRSLRAVFEHSWRSLGEREREVLARLSMFQAGFRREAAAAVAGATLATLVSLVDKSLLRVTPAGRYDLHPVLHHYAAEKLAERPDELEQAEARHWQHYSKWIHDQVVAPPSSKDPGLKRLVAAVTEERGNFLRAWRWALSRDQTDDYRDTAQLHPWLSQLPTILRAGGQLRASQQLLEASLHLADEQDPNLSLVIHSNLGATLFMRGEFAASLEQLERGIAVHEAHRSTLTTASSHDLVRCLGQASWCLWILGFPARALARARQSLELARRLGERSLLAHELFVVAHLHGLRREWEACERLSEEILELYPERDNLWTASALNRRGRALVERGEFEVGLGQLAEGVAEFRKQGWSGFLVTELPLQAGAYGLAGKGERALAVLAEAAALTESTGMRSWQAEIHRLEGVSLHQAGAPAHEVEARFGRALEVARLQGAKSWELRAALSLHQLWQAQGKRQQGRSLVAEVYHAYPEGHDTLDLQEARDLIDVPT